MKGDETAKNKGTKKGNDIWEEGYSRGHVGDDKMDLRDIVECEILELCVGEALTLLHGHLAEESTYYLRNSRQIDIDTR